MMIGVPSLLSVGGIKAATMVYLYESIHEVSLDVYINIFLNIHVNIILKVL